MDSFEINKIVAAVLIVALLLIGIGKLSEIIFYVEKPKTPGYVVEVEKVAASTTQVSSETTEEKIDIAALMALGDIATGEKVFKKCAACHSIVKGGKNAIGPALYNVVGRKVGAIEEYKYSRSNDADTNHFAGGGAGNNGQQEINLHDMLRMFDHGLRRTANP